VDERRLLLEAAGRREWARGSGRRGEGGMSGRPLDIGGEGGGDARPPAATAVAMAMETVLAMAMAMAMAMVILLW